MSKNDSIWKGFLDVVILPPPEVRDYAIELSTKLYEQGYTSWKLGLKERRPHLSLYHFSLNPRRSVSNAVEKLTRFMPAEQIEITGISSPRHGAIFLNTASPEWMQVFVLSISMALCGKNKIAVRNVRFMERWRQMELTPGMKANIKMWGSPFIGEGFVPHFTLGVVKDKERAQEIAASLPFRKMQWHVDCLHIVQVGDGWTAGEILGEIPLKNV